MRYELYYWSEIQGRGEFVRLALEEAGADYVDVARKRGDGVIDKLIGRKGEKHPPFALSGPEIRQDRHRAHREHPALARARASGLRRRMRPGGCGRISCSSPSRTSWWRFTTPIIR